MIKYINLIKKIYIKNIRINQKPKCFGYLCFPYGCMDELICSCKKECKYKKIVEI
jgi:RNA recognition motif-containing protein